MIRVRTLQRLVAPILVTSIVGCAPAYHSYSGCYVDCNYCPRPPLPYAHYDGCVCHSRAVAPYLHVVNAANEQDDVPEPRERQ